MSEGIRGMGLSPLVTSLGGGPTATVKAGQSLEDVAESAGVTTEDLKQVNPHLSTLTDIPAGTEIRLPVTAGQVTHSDDSAPEPGTPDSFQRGPQNLFAGLMQPHGESTSLGRECIAENAAAGNGEATGNTGEESTGVSPDAKMIGMNQLLNKREAPVQQLVNFLKMDQDTASQAIRNMR